MDLAKENFKFDQEVLQMSVNIPSLPKSFSQIQKFWIGTRKDFF